MCQIQDKFIIVSGSRKEVNQAAQRVELYDINQDEWIELAKINDGRHYHSSCGFNNEYIYVFGGIQNSNKKYSASIEKLKFTIGSMNNSWEKIILNKSTS